jgi:hypothetical protein
MKIEIDLHELKGVGRLHQDGFKISKDNETCLVYATTVPGGLPYILVEQGAHAGKIFSVTASEFRDALIAAFLAEPTGEPAPDIQLPIEIFSTAQKRMLQPTPPTLPPGGDRCRPDGPFICECGAELTDEEFEMFNGLCETCFEEENQ